MKFAIKEKVDAVKAIPGQVRMVTMLAFSALFVAFIALAMSVSGGRHAN
jgi:hypothetical protein